MYKIQSDYTAGAAKRVEAVRCRRNEKPASRLHCWRIMWWIESATHRKASIQAGLDSHHLRQLLLEDVGRVTEYTIGRSYRLDLHRQ